MARRAPAAQGVRPAREGRGRRRSSARPGALVPLDRTPLTHFETEAIGNAIVPSDRMERLRTHRRGGLRVLPRRRRAVPGQRLPPAGVDLRGPAQAPVRRPVVRGHGAPGRGPPAGGGGPRPRARHRPDGLRQDHDPGGDDRAREPHDASATSSRSRTRSRCCSETTSHRSTSARWATTPRLPRGAPGGPPPGPRRDPDRRDARHRRPCAPPCRRRRPDTSCCRRCTRSNATETVNRIVDFFPPTSRARSGSRSPGRCAGSCASGSSRRRTGP